MHAGNQTFNVAYHEEGVVLGGCIGWVAHGQATLHFIAVDPKIREQKSGVGTQLLSRFERYFADTRGVSEFSLITHRGAFKWFVNRGYTREEQTPPNVYSMIKYIPARS